jgi:hypothetical protein
MFLEFLHSQLHFDGILQPMVIVAIDGVVTGRNQNVRSDTIKSLLIVPTS